MRTTPEAEHDVTVALVRGLLRDQHPDFADLDLRLVANGWDNAIFRLGPDLGVRAPRRALAADLVAHEQRWLPTLAPVLPLPVPNPVRCGRPGRGYPWSWSVTDWYPGSVAADSALADPAREARVLGGFCAALHVPGPHDAPLNRFRGGPVSGLDGRLEENLAALGDRVDRGACGALWSRLRRAPEWGGAPVWLHGDLHTANILVNDGSISAVIDFGDITTGDPATDLAVAWMLFTPTERAVFRDAAGVTDDATWQRAAAWALHFGVIYLLHSADNQRFERMGTSLLGALLADDL